MDLLVRPSRLSGAIAVPGSKSHTIRGIAAALLTGGNCTLVEPLVSDDTRSALAAAQALGLKFRQGDRCWQLTGPGANFTEPDDVLDLGNSGTGLRLLTGIAATAEFPVSFDGDSSLRTRPMAGLLAALSQLGAECSDTRGFAPLTVRGPLRGGRAECDGMTSQFISALLFAATRARKPCEFTLRSLNEKPYVELTLGWLRRLGGRFTASADRLRYRVEPHGVFDPFEAVIPADFSTACFPLIGGFLFGDGVEIRNLDFSDAQGDKQVFEIAARMGARLNMSGSLTVEPSARPRGGHFDLNAVPDSLPILAVAAAYADGVTVLDNVPQARVKETDRIHCMAVSLAKMGVAVDELPSGLRISGGRPLHGAELDSCGDHRLAMSLALAGLGAEGETLIHRADAAGVTYPEFISDFERLGADFRILP